MAWRYFNLLFLACALVFGGVTLALGRLPAAAKCRGAAAPDTFLAYCRGVGDHEHAAYALGLEPAAVMALGRAKIVVLGNSRAQIAFSTPAMRRFAIAHAPAHLAGFGYEEGSVFALQVLARAGARPLAVIVNADPFFTDRLSPPAARIRDEPWRAFVAAWRNKAALGLRDAICAQARLPLLCRGSRAAVYRVRSDGSWVWEIATPGAGTEIDARPGAPLAPPWPAGIDRARAFLAALDLPARCLFVTAAPNSVTRADESAATLGAEIGATVILPQISGLRTADGSHLDPPSAERWSAAFLEAAEPTLSACLAEAPANAPYGRPPLRPPGSSG